MAKSKKSKAGESPTEDTPATPASDASVSSASPSQGLYEPPPRWRRILSLGHLASFATGLMLVYFLWGKFVERNGTGSNVVLVMLLAVAVLYMVTAHLGPWFDEILTRPQWRKARSMLRIAWVYLDDIDGLLKEGKRLDGAVFTQVEIQRLQQQQVDIKTAAYDVEHPPSGKPEEAPVEACVVHLENVIQRADIEMSSVMGTAKGGVLAQMRSLGIAFSVAVVLRLVVIEPFQIPSGSMIPTLLIGDHLFVARFWYGLPIPFLDEPKYAVRWGMPQPGDVVVFTAPDYVGRNRNAGEPWIKRVIAGPGQKVRIEDNVVFVDDKEYTHVGKPVRFRYKASPPHWSRESGRQQVERIGDFEHLHLKGSGTPVWPKPRTKGLTGLKCDGAQCEVEEGYIFVMGDNRDNSADGREWGAVKADNVKGKALFIWMSVDGSERSVDLGRFTLPKFRWDRIFTSIQ